MEEDNRNIVHRNGFVRWIRIGDYRFELARPVEVKKGDVIQVSTEMGPKMVINRTEVAGAPDFRYTVDFEI